MKPFEIGDLVTDFRFGKGLVSNITRDANYPIKVTFASFGNIAYTKSGKLEIDDIRPTLVHGYHDNLIIVPVEGNKVVETPKVESITVQLCGWICPVCGSGVSPYATKCGCEPRLNIKTATTGGTILNSEL